jgi:hypothetical protein
MNFTRLLVMTIIKNVTIMKKEIQNILDRNFTRGDNTKALEELCVLFDVSLSLLSVSKCPNSDCDNDGTIAYQTQSGEWESEPCEWCDRKKKLLSYEG